MKTVCVLLVLLLFLLYTKAENFTFCDGLSFQWKPITANHSEGSPLEGILIVTKEARPTVQNVAVY